MSRIVVTTSLTACPPRPAASLADTAKRFACSAVSALLSTVAVISAIDAAVCCTLDAACSVRALRSLLPCAISLLARCTLCTCSLTSSTSQRNISPSWLIVRSVMPISSTRFIRTPRRLSPVATFSAWSCSCFSGRTICVSSHSPAAIDTPAVAAANAASPPPVSPQAQPAPTTAGARTHSAA
ncbi:hypothetical protein BamMEX5DRAFT_6921 [Burkholderia ambifaria MEX-5]|uniref:Uncharacterized protein n=1 Tax=Burkholderia ambifaria MEX-5 TaxID=396597 RepID=B1TGK5_9BURK|nr:hypothetical protein BamMEX5DRAFT_6921 [Burkholderia ambifaria MEX-5]